MDRMSPLAITKTTNIKAMPEAEFVIPILDSELDYLEGVTDKKSRVPTLTRHLKLQFFSDRQDLRQSTMMKVAIVDVNDVQGILDYTQADKFLLEKSVYFVKTDNLFLIGDNMTMMAGDVNVNAVEVSREVKDKKMVVI
jgi:hypothetical protein